MIWWWYFSSFFSFFQIYKIKKAQWNNIKQGIQFNINKKKIFYNQSKQKNQQQTSKLNQLNINIKFVQKSTLQINAVIIKINNRHMNLSPLRKQVESLNKQLQTQNIQIQDLITFLRKSTPKQNNFNSKSSLKKQFTKTQSTSILKSFSSQKFKTSHKCQKQQLKKLKSLQKDKLTYRSRVDDQTKSKSLIRNLSKPQPQITKSVTHYNLKNILSNKKYLKLSHPIKRLNASCSFCKQSTNNLSQNTKPQQKLTESSQLYQKNARKTLKSINKNNLSNRSLKSISYKNVQNVKESSKNFSDKKKTVKHINQNQIFSKDQIRSFFDKKPNKKINQTKNKLSIDEGKILLAPFSSKISNVRRNFI